MKPRLLVVQRTSLSHGKLQSRSIGARFGPLLNYMTRHGLIQWECILETEITLKDFERFDAILLNKHSSQKGIDIIKTAKSIGLKTIYDMDDWILDLPSYSVTNLDEDILSNIVSMLKIVDVVTVSTDRLKLRLKFLRPDSILLPNGFDHEGVCYQPANPIYSVNNKILFSNTDGIKLISHREKFFKQLILFQEQHPNITIDFWGDQFPEMAKIPRLVDKGFLENEQYKKKIRDAGYLFAVVPLGGQEDEGTFQFNACKSCIKYIDYGSLGIPSIFSDSAVYSDVVINNHTGILVSNSGDDWLNAIELMYENRDLRDSIRVNAYQDCRLNFGVEKVADHFYHLLVV